MDWFIAIALTLSLGGSIAAPVGTILLKGYKEERRRILEGSNQESLPQTEQVYESESTAKKPQGLLSTITPVVESPVALINFRLPPFNRDRIIHESKGLMIIGDMGAAKTCVAQYIANGFTEHGIIVFDPHGKTNWGCIKLLLLIIWLSPYLCCMFSSYTGLPTMGKNLEVSRLTSILAVPTFP